MSSIKLGLPYETGEKGLWFSNLYTAIWDTGAQHSLVTEKIVNTYKLIFTGASCTIRGINGAHQANEYLASLSLAPNIVFPEISLYSIPDEHATTSFQIIIGLDIISRGNFMIKRSGNNLKFKFKL